MIIALSREAELRLKKIAEETGRDIEDLARCAVEEAALASFRYRKDDPAEALK